MHDDEDAAVAQILFISSASTFADLAADCGGE